MWPSEEEKKKAEWAQDTLCPHPWPTVWAPGSGPQKPFSSAGDSWGQASLRPLPHLLTPHRSPTLPSLPPPIPLRPGLRNSPPSPSAPH